jgi:hypothetical protein
MSADTFTRMLHAVDALDWQAAESCFADSVRTDYTSLWGGEPSTTTPAALMADWQSFAPGFDATQHVTGPIVLTDDAGPGVRAETHIRAYHVVRGADGGDVWAVHGHYTFRLVDGLIAELTLHILYQEGNLDLPAVARQRAAATPHTVSAR